MKFRKGIAFLSFILLPITLNYFAPFLIVQSSLEKTFSSMHIVYGCMLVGAIFGGGIWCSTICPFGALQELAPNATRLKHKLPNLKWLTGGIFLALIFGPILLSGFQKVIFFYHMEDMKVSVSSFRDLFRYYIIVMSILFITIVLGKRTWCRYLCPMYIFNYLGVKISRLLKLPSFKIISEGEKCIHCNKCTKSCPMGLEVEEMVKENKWNTNECIHCKECIEACKHNVIQTKFQK